ncbi:MAG: universal stress protein [Brooklawnia sp.]|uniref:universal stress protein n=1 Tax=Brooklawnia sp. TaxID=2699740 RepID=UPI003C70F17D
MNLQLDARDRIVVGTDGSRRADHAVDWAAERAEVLDVPLLVLHVVAGSPNPSNAFSAVAANFDGDLLREAHERLARVVERVHQRHPRLDLTGEVVVGNASWVLAEASKQALLVVVGARGQSAPLTVRVLGGVSDQVTAHATGPIAVVPDEALENPRGPVVLGVDESPEARAAMWFAFRAAEARGVPVLAIHAWGDKDSHDIVSRVSALVEGMLADARAEYPDVPVEVRIVHGRPHHELVHASKDAGLVVVGSRGIGGFTGLLLGSTSKRVLRDAHCPVIVTRA